MNYRIVEKDEFTVFGRSITLSLEENPYEVVPKLWMDIQEDGTYQKICKVAGFEPYSGDSLNAALYDFDNDGSYRNKYMIYSSIPQDKEIPEEFDIMTIPAAKWVVFSDTYETVEESTSKIQKIWKRIFTEWFPTSDYEATNSPQLEVYPTDCKTVEVWIPVIKKRV